MTPPLAAARERLRIERRAKGKGASVETMRVQLAQARAKLRAMPKPLVPANSYDASTKRKLMLRGLDVLDKRTPSFRAYINIRKELLEHLGGDARVSAPQRHLVDIVTRGLLYLSHLDVALLERPTLVYKKTQRNRALPLLEQRMSMSKIVASQLQMLGFTKITRLKSLAEELAASPELLTQDGEPVTEREDDT